MNCRILHERPGRLRVHMRQCNMSLSEADRLEAYLKGISGVIEVKVYERTADAVIRYRFVMSFNGALIGLGAVGLMPPGTSAMLHNGSTLLLSIRSMTNLL